MTKTWSRCLLGAALTLSVVVLSGCVSQVRFSDLEREQTPQLSFPSLPDADLGDGVDTESARYVGSHGGADLWLMRNGRDGACLLVYPSTEDWYMGCAEASNLFGASGPAGEFFVQPDDHPAPTQPSEQISTNVYAVVDEQ